MRTFIGLSKLYKRKHAFYEFKCRENYSVKEEWFANMNKYFRLTTMLLNIVNVPLYIKNILKYYQYYYVVYV